MSDILLFVLLPKVSRTQCQESFIGLFEIKDNQICYGFQKGGRDSCKVGIIFITNFNINMKIIFNISKAKSSMRWRKYKKLSIN